MDAVLAKTGRVQLRVRKLPSRVVVYFVLAMALFTEHGYRGVWACLVAGAGLPDVDPSAAALRQARRRIGSAPLAALFDEVKGAAAAADTPGSWWQGLRVVAWDGTGLQVPDSPENLAVCGRAAGKFGLGGFPLMWLTVLVECGTRTLIDAIIGPWKQSEKDQALLLCRALRPGMLVLADRGSKGVPLACAAAATGAHLLWRTSTDRLPPVLHLLPDGTYLSMATSQNERARLARWTRHRQGVPPQAQGLALRVIEATVTVRTAGGNRHTTHLRLVTTLLDHEQYPATELAELYHERWQVETAYLGLKVTLRGPGRVLRSQTFDGARQELFGLLIVYQAARLIAADAAGQAGIDPDRISLTVTLRAARLTVLSATGSTATSVTSPTPRIRRAILHPRELGPAHRGPRILPRRVKRPISTFAYNTTRKDPPFLDPRDRHHDRRTSRSATSTCLTSRHWDLPRPRRTEGVLSR
ncbi:IS4 family transposase [Streptomyces sp. WM6378]|uniref:IS4 family transposase n=1 Tax=Streptomyces sp. WM6378 TaxID=1415557 RepID=UPI0006AF2F20